MEAGLCQEPGPSSECSTRLFDDESSFKYHTVAYAVSLAMFCAYFVRLTSKWRKPRPGVVSAKNTIRNDSEVVPHTDHDATRPLNVDVLYQTKPIGGQISSLAFLADGKHVVFASKVAKTIQLWNTSDTEEKDSLMEPGVAVNVMASFKDEQRIVTGHTDGNMVVWDIHLHKRCEVAERLAGLITALDVSSFSSCIASGSNNGEVVVWRIGEVGFPLVQDLLMRHGTTSISSVKFSPSGNRIASACAEWGCSVKIWHTRTGDQLTSIRVNASPIHSLAWSTDGQRLFAGYHNGSVGRFDMVTGKLFPKVVEPRPGNDSITSLHVANSEQFLISFSSPGRTVDIWDTRCPGSKHICSYSRCVAACNSPDDLYLATGDTDGKITIRSLPAIVEVSALFHHIGPPSSQSEPFTYISPAAHQAWKRGKLEEAEVILSREMEDARFQGLTCYARANRALLRVRRKNLIGALDDIDEIMRDGGRIPPMAHIAKAMALIEQGKRTEAIDAFGSIHLGDTKDMAECIQSVLLFELEYIDKRDSGTELDYSSILANDCSCPWVRARKLLLLAERHMRRREYDQALGLLTKSPDFGPSLHTQETMLLPLVFGWDLYDLESMVQQRLCQALFASRRTSEVIGVLHVRENRLDEELEARKADLGWLNEKLGDEAMHYRQYDDAITWYSVALGLCPESRVTDYGSDFAKRCLSEIEDVSDGADRLISQDLDLISRYPPGSARLLAKRSKAKAMKGSWDDALEDAGKAIEADQSCPWGYERKYVALDALHRYPEATEILDKMVTKLEESADPVIRELRKSYIAPSETISAIDKQITAIFEISPLVLINVRTGRLCDATERIRIFKADSISHELVSSMATATKLDTERIGMVVARYFRYVMFSHTWEGKEPTFQDLSGRSVDELDPLPLNQKLRRFCEMVRGDPEGYLWAWSDTCCIDKNIETVYRKSIRSMYSWYKASALTIVLLARGSTPSSLKNNRWMTRAWTFQELLAPKSIRFYDREWNLYQSDALPNHKESSDIMRELAEAIDVTQETLLDFSPQSLSIRAKLRLASTREATEKVDIAYALIGIFSSDLIPEYRDPEDALGLLLQEIVHRERDAKAVLCWVGTSSQFNSCLPSQIAVYQHSPYTPSPISENKVDARVKVLRTVLPEQDVTTFFESLSALGPIDFSHRRLSLPCVVFAVSVDIVEPDDAPTDAGQTLLYRAQAAGLGQIQFRVSHTEFNRGDEVVLVYPWIRDLLADSNLPDCSDNYTRGLRLLAHLEQPFRGLLLVRQSVDTYRRIAAGSAIVTPHGDVVSLKGIDAKVLQIR